MRKLNPFAVLSAILVTIMVAGGLRPQTAKGDFPPVQGTGGIRTGVVDVPHGGTNQTSYTVGDLLYASSATSLSRLGIGQIGSVLTSNGAGVAPSWSGAPTGGGGGTTITGTTRGGIANYGAAGWAQIVPITTANYVLTSQGVGADPAYKVPGDPNDGIFINLDSSVAASLFQDSALTTPATANNDPVGGWKDQSPYAHNFTQATGGNRPKLTTHGPNGLNVVTFTAGSSTYMTTPATVYPSTYSVIAVVARPWTTGAALDIVLFANANAAAGIGIAADFAGGGFQDFPSTRPIGFYGNGYTTATPPRSIGQYPVSADSTYHVISATCGMRSHLFWDGTEVGTAYANSGGSSSASTVMNLGRWPGNSNFWDGAMAQVIFFDRELSTATRVYWESTLRTKWGTP